MSTGYMMDPLPWVPPAKLSYPYSHMPAGWNDSPLEWKLPDDNYSKERREEMLEKYQKCLKFEDENDFLEESYMFLTDYWDLLEMKREKDEKEEREKKEREERGEKEEKEELIPLTKPIDYDDLDDLIDNYDYDSNDEEVNNFNEIEAENFIRSTVIKYRKSIGKQI